NRRLPDAAGRGPRAARRRARRPVPVHRRREQLRGGPRRLRRRADRPADAVRGRRRAGRVPRGRRAMSVWTVQAPFPGGLRGRLGEILVDSVEHGASVGFLAPLDRAAADDYWRRVERAVADGRSILLAAESGGAVAGTVQVDVDTPPNQPHRAT